MAPLTQRLYLCLLSLSLNWCVTGHRQDVAEKRPYEHTQKELPSINASQHVHQALSTLQDTFFQLWVGDWPTANDWTGALTSSHISTTLASISASSPAPDAASTVDHYFLHIAAYYFGEDAFSIRAQAHDDMLWVVLGWLDAIKLIGAHSRRWHHDDDAWHGAQMRPAFAHRAHVFYDIVHRAWDPALCGGGLTWNPRLPVYKNTITNTLYIAASVAMYLHHPGDNNTAPFASSSSETYLLPPLAPRSPFLLQSAITAYAWLRAVNLTNAAGLLVDGYHISAAARRSGHGPTQCDVRSEAVYSYNQGVLLAGLRGLHDATREPGYLRDGHALVRSVVRATGWFDDHDGGGAGAGAGAGALGRHGVLADRCDAGGWCNQDAQAFKGVFFANLVAFCEPLGGGGRVANAAPADDDDGVDERELERTKHARQCAAYHAWVSHNARAALRTRDAGSGVFGGWWGAGAGGDEWVATATVAGEEQRRLDVNMDDVNDRGRGRTVETQGSGLAVVRALWAFETWFGPLVVVGS